MIAFLGRTTLDTVAGLGDLELFTTRALRSVSDAPGLGRRWMRTIHEHGVGVRSLPVVVIVGAFTGLAMGLQGYHVMRRFGSESLVGSFVSLTLAPELAPVLVALVIVGQAGSALAAELGLQRNIEQIDAVRTMDLDPLNRNAVFEMIARFRREFDGTAIVVTHDVAEALAVSDSVALLESGRMRFQGSPADFNASGGVSVMAIRNSQTALRARLDEINQTTSVSEVTAL